MKSSASSDKDTIVNEILTVVHGGSLPKQEGDSCRGEGRQDTQVRVALEMLYLHHQDRGRGLHASNFSGGAKYGRSGESLDIGPEIYQ